jgi:hypothetical protein
MLHVQNGSGEANGTKGSRKRGRAQVRTTPRVAVSVGELDAITSA